MLTRVSHALHETLVDAHEYLYLYHEMMKAKLPNKWNKQVCKGNCKT